MSLMPQGSEVHLGMDMVFADLSIKNRETGELASSETHSKNRGRLASAPLRKAELERNMERAVFFPAPPAALIPGSRTRAAC